MGNRIGKKGVDAIFTPSRQRDYRFLVGMAAILLGITLWAIVILDSRYPTLFGASAISSYSSLVMFSIGEILIISGTGISVTYYSFDLPLKSLNSLRDRSAHETDTHPSSNLRHGMIAFIQSSVAIALYSGLSDEYNSNSSMQEWIHARFPPGQLLLGRECVLVVAALLGLFIIQFLPGQAFAEG